MKPSLRQMVEDRIYVKATQVLRRRITQRELSTFFIHNTTALEKTYQQFEKELDKVLEAYLEKIK